MAKALSAAGPRLVHVTIGAKSRDRGFVPIWICQSVPMLTRMVLKKNLCHALKKNAMVRIVSETNF